MNFWRTVAALGWLGVSVAYGASSASIPKIDHVEIGAADKDRVILHPDIGDIRRFVDERHVLVQWQFKVAQPRRAKVPHVHKDIICRADIVVGVRPRANLPGFALAKWPYGTLDWHLASRVPRPNADPW